MAKDLKDLQVGDHIVRFGVVHRITKVEMVPNADGEEDKIVHFEPVYKNRRNETLRLSIPVKNLSDTTIRLPENITAIRNELKFLREGEYEPTPFNRIKVRKIINTNQLRDVTQVLKTMWEEKRDKDKNFTISKRNTFLMVMRRFQQEVAHVLDISLEEAEEMITSALDTGWKRKSKSTA